MIGHCPLRREFAFHPGHETAGASQPQLRGCSCARAYPAADRRRRRGAAARMIITIASPQRSTTDSRSVQVPPNRPDTPDEPHPLRQAIPRVEAGHGFAAAECRPLRRDADGLRNRSPLESRLTTQTSCDLGFCWWQVLGSNQRRLSRRFYRASADYFRHSPDLQLHGCRSGRPPTQPLLDHERPQPGGRHQTLVTSRHSSDVPFASKSACVGRPFRRTPPLPASHVGTTHLGLLSD